GTGGSAAGPDGRRVVAVVAGGRAAGRGAGAAVVGGAGARVVVVGAAVVVVVDAMGIGRSAKATSTLSWCGGTPAGEAPAHVETPTRAAANSGLAMKRRARSTCIAATAHHTRRPRRRTPLRLPHLEFSARRTRWRRDLVVRPSGAGGGAGHLQAGLRPGPPFEEIGELGVGLRVLEGGQCLVELLAGLPGVDVAL